MSAESRFSSHQEPERGAAAEGSFRAGAAHGPSNGPSGREASGDDTAGGDDEHPADIEALRNELAAAEENARAQRELYLRTAAEMDNVRKRAQRDIEQAHRYAIEGLASELLNVRDSLELAVRNAASADPATLAAGQEATLKLLDRAFEKFSIKPIVPLGQRFDPSQHEAVLMQEATAAPNSVLQVVQTGYDLNGRLLRPARVIVAKARGSDGSEG